MRSTLSVAIAIGAFASFALAASACGGGGEEGGGAKGPAVTKRSTEVQHEPCEGRGEAIDVNGDGKPDIRRIVGGNGREICRVTDLNHNGKPDLFQYFDDAGNLRRREADFDESGVVDAIETYEGGKLVRVEYDTLAHHKIDTWDFFDPATGKRVRRERDSKGTGKVDQWWTWDGEKVTIAFDRDGDGQPDPQETITLGDTGAPPTAKSEAGPPPSTASEVGSLDGGGSPATTVQPQSAPLEAGAPTLSSTPDAGAKTKPRGKR